MICDWGAATHQGKITMISHFMVFGNNNNNNNAKGATLAISEAQNA